MLKKLLILAVVSGILAAVASLVYQKVYAESLGDGFKNIISMQKIFVACIGANIVAAIGYFLLSKVLKGYTEAVFNILFAVITIATIVYPIGYKLPLDVEMPELFPGLAIPMHFFPVLGWMTLKPLFAKNI
jgi:ABC-type Fe3+-siderophore transport system permease subunit